MAQRSSLFLIAGACMFALMAFAFSLFTFLKQSKIAYVNNDLIFAKYQGLVENKSQYEIQLKSWQANLDTLSQEFNNEVKEFQKNSSIYTSKEKLLKEELLKKKEEDLFLYKQALERKAKEEEAKLTSGVINQINSHILDFGKKHNYDFILGATDNGNILFAKDADDITDEVIQYINDKYAGK